MAPPLRSDGKESFVVSSASGKSGKDKTLWIGRRWALVLAMNMTSPCIHVGGKGLGWPRQVQQASGHVQGEPGKHRLVMEAGAREANWNDSLHLIKVSQPSKADTVSQAGRRDGISHAEQRVLSCPRGVTRWNSGAAQARAFGIQLPASGTILSADHRPRSCSEKPILPPFNPTNFTASAQSAPALLFHRQDSIPEPSRQTPVPSTEQP